MATWDIVITLTLLALAGLWYSSFRAQEAGVRYVRRACEEEGLQLLDETIALNRIRLRRDETGRLAIMRVYGFEYSDTGDNRRKGSVHLLGDKVILLNLWLLLVASGGRLHRDARPAGE